MGLESITHVGDLNVSNPTSSDPKRQGDDHLRGIKTALRNDFAGFAGAIKVTGVDGGTADAYTLTPTTALTAYGTNMEVTFTPTATNTTTSPTLNISGLGVKNIKRVDGSAPVSGDLVSGVVYHVVYNGTEFRLRSITKQYADQLAFSTALPVQSGNSGKFLSTDGSVAAWTSITGIGGTTASGSTVLTSTAPGAQVITPTAQSQYVQLPDATTITKSSLNYTLRNVGTYNLEIRDGSGSRLGWIHPQNTVTCGLADNSTSAGVWALSGASKTARIFKTTWPFTTSISTTNYVVTIDATRTLILVGGTDLYGVVYDTTVGFVGSFTLIRSGIGNGLFSAALTATTGQVLVVSCSSTTALEAVTLSISGTTITVNSGTKGTATLAGNAAAFRDMVLVGTSLVVSYGRATNVSAIRAISISGTTPTIGAESTLTPAVATAANLYVSGNVVRTVHASATTLYAKPFTVSGSTLSAGTEASTGTTSSDIRIVALSGGNLLVQYLNTSHFAAVFKLAGTTESASATSVGTAPADIVGSNCDLIAVSATKALAVYRSGSVVYSNVINDTAGTISVGTELAITLEGTITAVLAAYASSGVVSCIAKTANTVNIFNYDTSAASPTIYLDGYHTITPPSSTTFPPASSRNGTKSGRLLRLANRAYILGDNAVDISVEANYGFSLLPSEPTRIGADSYSPIAMPDYVTHGVAITTGGSVGFYIYRVEAAA